MEALPIIDNALPLGDGCQVAASKIEEGEITELPSKAGATTPNKEELAPINERSTPVADAEMHADEENNSDAASVKEVAEPATAVETVIAPAETDATVTTAEASAPAVPQLDEAPATTAVAEVLPAVADVIPATAAEETSGVSATAEEVAAQPSAEPASRASADATGEEVAAAEITLPAAATEAVPTDIASAPTSGVKRSRAEAEKEDAGPELRRSASKKSKN